MASAGDRESLSTDVVIVGAGPSGLAAAIRLKQSHPDIAVTVVEKSADIGGHILSGAVMDPKGLDALIPDWREKGAPVGPDVSQDHFHLLTATGDLPIPDLIIPPLMKTPNGVIVSLGDLCRWLGEQATALSVDIYPMTAAVDVVTGELRPADIGIVGALIASVHEPAARSDAATLIDASGAFVSPGLIDTHMHVESSLVTPAMSLTEPLKLWPAA